MGQVMDKFGTKTGHLSRHSFSELGGFMGQGKNCCLVQIGIFPIEFQLLSNNLKTDKKGCCA